MPCDSVRLLSVTLEKHDAQTMLLALSNMSLQPVLSGDVIRFGNGEWINTKTGQSRLAASRTVNEIKQAYSKAIVQKTARRFGWQLKVDAKNPNQMQILKR